MKLLIILPILLLVLVQSSAISVAGGGTGTIKLQIHGYGDVYGQIQNPTLQGNTATMLVVLNDMFHLPEGDFPVFGTSNWVGTLSGSSLSGSFQDLYGTISICTLTCNNILFAGQGSWTGKLDSSMDGHGKFDGTVTVTDSSLPEIPVGLSAPISGTWIANFGGSDTTASLANITDTTTDTATDTATDTTTQANAAQTTNATTSSNVTISSNATNSSNGTVNPDVVGCVDCEAGTMAISSDSTISQLQVLPELGAIILTTDGAVGTIAHTSINFSKGMVFGNPVVTFDVGAYTPRTILLSSNSTHYFLTLIYDQGPHDIVISGSNQASNPTAQSQNSSTVSLPTLREHTQKHAHPIE